MDIINCLNIFVAVAEQKSMLKAANKLHVSQSKISKHITWLEDYYNVHLFVRSTRKLQLTECGNLLYQKAKALLSDFSLMKYTISKPTNGLSGSLCVSITGYGIPIFIIKAIAKFLKKYPCINISLTSNPDSFPMNLGNQEIALTFAKVKHTNLQNKPIAVIKQSFVGSPQYFKKNGVPKKIDDLLKHNCLIYTHKSIQNRWIINNKEILINGSFQSNSEFLIKKAAIEGMGIAWLPDTTIAYEIQTGILKKVLTKYSSPPLIVFAYYHDSLSSVLIEKFITFLQQYVLHDEVFSQFLTLIDENLG